MSMSMLRCNKVQAGLDRPVARGVPSLPRAPRRMNVAARAGPISNLPMAEASPKAPALSKGRIGGSGELSLMARQLHHHAAPDHSLYCDYCRCPPCQHLYRTEGRIRCHLSTDALSEIALISGLVSFFTPLRCSAVDGS